MAKDVRYALRVLRRSPLFALTVIATMGLGLGLLGSAFTIVNAYLFQPIDLPDPYALHSLSWDTGTTRRHRFSLADYEALQPEGSRLAGLAATEDVTIMRDGRSTGGLLVTGNYFELLGSRAALGRLLRPSDASVRGEVRSSCSPIRCGVPASDPTRRSSVNASTSDGNASRSPASSSPSPPSPVRNS